jgi:hypothetical protein
MITTYTLITYTNSLFLWHIDLILMLGEEVCVAGSTSTGGKPSREELFILTMETAVPAHTKTATIS